MNENDKRILNNVCTGLLDSLDKNELIYDSQLLLFTNYITMFLQNKNFTELPNSYYLLELRINAFYQYGEFTQIENKDRLFKCGIIYGCTNMIKNEKTREDNLSFDENFVKKYVKEIEILKVISEHQGIDSIELCSLVQMSHKELLFIANSHKMKEYCYLIKKGNYSECFISEHGKKVVEIYDNSEVKKLERKL